MRMILFGNIIITLLSVITMCLSACNQHGPRQVMPSPDVCNNTPYRLFASMLANRLLSLLLGLRRWSPMVPAER